MTPEQFLKRFDFYADEEDQEFIFSGCRDLLLEVKHSGLTSHQQEIVKYLRDQLLCARKNSSEHIDLNGIRQELIQILEFEDAKSQRG